MLNPLTAACLDHGLVALRAAQMLPGDDGESVPEPGEVSLRVLAEFCGVAEGTILSIERLALAKLARGLRGGELPPHLAGAFCALIDNPEQPELF